MRLITRSDFDGLACAALLKEAGIIDHWKFAHPKDLQDGLVEVNEDDCLANVPYVEGCGLWFDHHSSEQERPELEYINGSRFAKESDTRGRKWYRKITSMGLVFLLKVIFHMKATDAVCGFTFLRKETAERHGSGIS